MGTDRSTQETLQAGVCSANDGGNAEVYVYTYIQYLFSMCNVHMYPKVPALRLLYSCQYIRTYVCT